ncbi:tail fiber domain-containing protein [Martelella mediterranea]|uniref:Peptidase S74 domain-containing protein n=1 Tax=Martelella mediterranea DSM 17316 TaxID=1122214 RepID=A0A1U9Z2M0_9HYPH|nr:tail fiber domain-containing protein [Martelella mediterranea]AQZ51900.1 hypothetical protein Mame_02574 [Martelella mediterranea DSM 17316]
MTAYATGTITLTNGSRAVTGDGTGWATALIAGGVIYPQAAGNPLPIASVDSDTAITAATEWVGASGTYAYALQRQDDANQVIANAAALADYIQRLDNRSLSAIAALTPSADRLPYFNGEDSATLTSLTAFGRALIAAGNATTALNTLGISNFARSLLDDADQAAARTTLGAQAALGYTPVQQGTGAGQNPGSGVKIGWSDAGVLRLQVDNTDFGGLWPISVSGNAAYASNAGAVGGKSLANLAQAAGDRIFAPGATRVGFQGGSSISVIYSNNVRFAWDSGFYYSIDGNNFVLINSLPSDAKFKDVVEEGEPNKALESLSPVRWQRKDNIPVGLPEGDRLGFFAQDLQAFDPAMVRETTVPDKSGETYLALADDADMQLIAHMWRAVCALSDRVAELEAAASSEA